jgi:hypothetical protein
MSAQYREAAKDLFRQHRPHQKMRPSLGPKGNVLLGMFAEAGRQAIRTADDKDKVSQG